MRKIIGIILISIFYLILLRNVIAGYYSDPDPQIDISDSQISMRKELSGYPNYGVTDGKADVLYSKEENSWWFKELPPDLNYTHGQVTLSLVSDDHYGIEKSEYCAKILVNGNELFSGSLASLEIEHGEPYGERFNNWKLVYFPLRINSHEIKVTVINCSNLSGLDWIAIDNIKLVISKYSSVELTEFKSNSNKENIHLTWLTGTEINNVGFRLWRATKDQYGSYEPIILKEFAHPEQVNPEPNEDCSTKIQGQLKTDNSNQLPQLISAIGNSAESTCYSFTDTSDLSDGTYYYLLEDIDDNGKSTFHCDHIDAVTVGQGPAIDLPLAMNYCKEVTGSED